VFLLTLRFVSLDAIYNNPPYYSAVAAMFAFVAGPAAAVGGAVATITLARAALSVSRRQESRQANEFIETRVNEATKRFSELAASLSQVTASGIQVEASLSEITEQDPDVSSYADKPLSGRLLDTVNIFRQSLSGLRENLTALQLDRFPLAIYKTTLAKEDSALDKVAEKLVEHGFTELESEISRTDLAMVIQVIRIAENRLQYPDFSNLLAPRLSTNLANAPSVGMAYDNAALRSFIFCGNLIYNRTEHSKKIPNVLISASYGTAIIADLARSIPDSSSIRSNLRNLYPDLDEYIHKMFLDFDAQQILGEHFTFALSSLEEKPGLLFLEAGD
jgi:hypothetical protein